MLKATQGPDADLCLPPPDLCFSHPLCCVPRGGDSKEGLESPRLVESMELGGLVVRA